LDESGFTNALQTAIATGDYEELPERIDRESDFGFSFPYVEGGGPLPEVVFAGMLELMGQPGFLAAEDSHEFLYFFRYNWEILTPEQRERLRVVLREAYPKYHDSMARFETSELFGEYFGDEKALEDLLALMKLERSELRELVPTGLDHLARQTARPDLATRALARLEEARADPDPRVRNEAEESFMRIQVWREDRAEREEQAAILGPITSEKRWDESVFSRVLQTAANRENYLVLADWLDHECDGAYLLELAATPVPADSELIFSELLGLLKRPGFLADMDAFRVLGFFDSTCSNLTSDQLERLRPALREALPKFRTPSSHTAAAKLLARRFPDDETLADLLMWMQDEDPNIRAAIPEALGSLATQSAQPGISARALAGLEEARMDQRADVRHEVELSLDRVRGHRGRIARPLAQEEEE